MADYRCPLATRLERAATKAGRDGDGTGITLRSTRPASLHQIAGWGDTFIEDIAPLAKALHLDGAGSFTAAQQHGACLAFRIAPRRLLIQHDTPAELEAALGLVSEDRLAKLDLGHARVIIHVAGPDAEALMTRLLTVDVSPAAFPSGDFRQTSIHHMSTLIFRSEDDCFCIYAASSAAGSMWDYVMDCAKPFITSVRSD